MSAGRISRQDKSLALRLLADMHSTRSITSVSGLSLLSGEIALSAELDCVCCHFVWGAVLAESMPGYLSGYLLIFFALLTRFHRSVLDLAAGMALLLTV